MTARQALAPPARCTRVSHGTPPVGTMLYAREVPAYSHERLRRRHDNAHKYVSAHPVVRTHPETGRKALYVNNRHTIRFRDMTEAESRPLTDWLQAHCTRPEFTARIRWEKGTITIWDNRCCQHFAINDYTGQRRVLWRLPVGAEVPVA